MSDLLANSEVVWNSQRTRPVKIRGEFALPAAANAPDAIQKFLVSNARDLALPFPAEGLKLVHSLDTPIRKIFRFDHSLDGIPVFGAQLLVHVDGESRIRHIETYSGPTNIVAPPAGGKLLDAAAASKAAGDSLGAFSKRLDTPPPSQVWLPTSQGLVKAYRVLIATAAPAHDWEIFVDAYSGKILQKHDLIKEMPDGSGMVFDPNPVVTAKNSAFRDPTATMATCGFNGTAQATIDAQRVSRTLKGLTLSAGKYTLDGPYCRIHNFGAPASTIPAEASGNFNYPSNDERFEAVMVYYHIDSFQRYLQSIGITTAHPTVIQCDPHDNSINAAWFSPVDGGLHFSDSGACKPDRGEDADCMIHEYGHAIQNYQVPGWGAANPGTGRNESGAMGEGFGDFLACVYLAERSGGFQREVFEDWVFAPAGLRRVDGTKVYPGSWVSEVHSDGEIWSAALWNIFRSIGGDSMNAATREAARQAIFHSVIESHPLLAANATMPDGAEAVMTTNAELPQYRGQHLMQMLDSFHDRGLLPVNAGANLYIRDDVADPGTESYHSTTFWDSPDLWVRNANDNGTTNQAPKAGHDNWFYARVRNRGTAAARAFVVTFNVKLWLGTEFKYPADFINPMISAAVGFNLAAGGNMVVKAKWPAALVPSAGSHGCMLASVYTPREHVPANTHVWDHGNLAQKNLEILSAGAGDTVSVSFRFGNRLSQVGSQYRLEVRKESAELAVSVVGNPEILKTLAGAPVLAARGDAAEAKLDVEPIANAAGALTELRFVPGKVVGLPLDIKPRSDVALGFKISVPKTSRPGDTHTVDIVQRDANGQTVGGIRVQVLVR